MKDESASHRYTFPVGFVLFAGETVKLHAGCGEDFGGSLYWCKTGTAVWNNDGDTAFLLDRAGNIHTTFAYAPATTTAAATTTTKPATTTTKPAGTTTTAKAAANCDPHYPTVCIPPYPPDLNCGDIPYKRFKVLQPDPHGFDRDKDGIGCKS